MKKRIFFPVLSAFIGVLLAVSISFAEAKKVKVQIHVVKDSGISEQQIRDWINKTNQIDGPNVTHVVDSNHFYPDPNTDANDPNKNDPNRINIWGVPKCTVTGEPNFVSGRKGNIIELVPGRKDSNDPNDPNGNNVYIKDSTLAHEINHIHLGPAHSDDPNNKMYPDNHKNAQGKYKSCHRKDTNMTPEQRATVNACVAGMSHDAMDSGYGIERYDATGDGGFGYIDLDWTQCWIQLIQGGHILHLTGQVKSLSFTDFSEIGFYIESDNDMATGQPPEGLDHYVAYRPLYNEIIFQIYEAGMWMNLPAAGIGYELNFIDKDADIAPIAAGIEIEMPMELLIRRAGDFLSYKAVAHNYVEMDFSPDEGLLTMQVPQPIAGDLNDDVKVNNEDLEIMTDEWLKIGDSVADIYPAFDGDKIVNFRDFAVLANNWLVGTEL